MHQHSHMNFKNHESIISVQRRRRMSTTPKRMAGVRSWEPHWMDGSDLAKPKNLDDYASNESTVRKTCCLLELIKSRANVHQRAGGRTALMLAAMSGCSGWQGCIRVSGAFIASPNRSAIIELLQLFFQTVWHVIEIEWLNIPVERTHCVQELLAAKANVHQKDNYNQIIIIDFLKGLVSSQYLWYYIIFWGPALFL